MRRGSEELAALAQGFAHQTEFKGFEILQAAADDEDVERR